MRCSLCGKPTGLQVGDRPVCEECYVNAGSCCPEFGNFDLWQPARRDRKVGPQL